MNEVPTLSVVMGVYNHPERLPETLESIRAQTETDWELIVVNDGSTDPGVEAVLNEFASSEPRAKVITKENEGLTRALIDGCLVAQGIYVARIDAGDVMTPERLALQRARLDSDAAITFVSCWTEVCGPDWEPLYVKREYTSESGERMIPDRPDGAIRKAPTHHGSVMFRADRYRDVKGYHPSFYYGQDWDLWYRLAETGRFAVVQEVLYRCRLFPTSISARNRRRQDAIGQCALEALWARMRGESEAVPLERASAIRPGWDDAMDEEEPGAGEHFIGSLLQACGDSRCRQYYKQALRENPWRWKTWIRYLQSGAMSVVRPQRNKTT